jgi:hypothetical protein
MEVQEAAEGGRVGDMHVTVALGVAKKSVLVGILAGDVDKDESVAGTLLGQQLVHAVHVGPSLLVGAEVGVFRILELPGLTDRRWDIVNAEPQARQALEIRQKRLDVSLDGGRNRLPIIRAEFVNMTAAVDLTETTDDGIAVRDAVSAEIEAISTNAVHQSRA